MTFSAQVKRELARVPSKKTCCMRAELMGFAYVSGVVLLRGGGDVELLLQCDTEPIARRILALIKRGWKLSATLQAVQRMRGMHYELSLSGSQAGEVLLDTGIFQRVGTWMQMGEAFPMQGMTEPCCRHALLRGAFLGAGYVGDPAKRYHMEFSLIQEQTAHALQSLLQAQGFSAKTVMRKERPIVYIKDGEQIADLIAQMGAHSAYLDWENARVVREVRGQVNRVVNCETANLEKTSRVASRQVQCIQTVCEAMHGLEHLPPVLREIAQLRLENPEATLEELGSLLENPISKSGVNHRMRRLEKLAEKLELSAAP